MADSAVSSLLQNLSRLLVDEVKLLSGVEDKIRSLSNEFKFIDIFLKSSEGKRGNKIVKEVVNQIRDVAHKVEDVVDTYVAEASIQRSRNILSKLVHYPSHMMMLHDVDAEIEKIKRSIDEIYKNKDRYSIREGEFQSGDDTEESLRKRRRDVEEDEVVGLVHDSSFVIKQLKETSSRREVVSIIGMGGLGKTTLARKIYNNKEVQELFPYRAWGYVSNDYRVKELLLSLLKCLLSMSEYNDLFKKRDDEVIVSESEEKMKQKMKESLRGKKYLVVLDDIWKIQVWNEIQGAFPNDNNGSRILITSRMKEVASYTGITPPYYLPFLNEKESWELFSKKVFRGEDCPSDLEDTGRSIVQSCGGLPLAIVVLAGLVAKKDKSQTEWLRIKDHVHWHLSQEDITMDILKLSYDSLPQKLKPCFLYFGIYPEDYQIPVRQLIELWIAEGFIQPPKIGTSKAPELEDIGDYYLDELVDRSLVQVTSMRSDGGVKTCQIHDLLRDLCIFESKVNKFMETYTELDIDKCNSRRMSLHCKTQFSFSPTKYNQSRTRSLFLFGEDPDGNNESKSCGQIMACFKLARVLHLNRMCSELVLSSLKAMVHLRYLRLCLPYKINKDVLASICRLWNLETLHVDYYALPNLERKRRLRHFNLRVKGVLSSWVSRGENSERLPNLHALYAVPIDSQTLSLLNNDYFPNLKKLGLSYVSWWKDNLSLLSLHHLSKLRRLKLDGSGIKFFADTFSPNFFPSNLTKIAIVWFEKLDSKTLGRLPNLRILKLSWGNIGDCLHCAAGEFPALQVFQMRHISVPRWSLEKGAMSCLSRLLIEAVGFNDLPEQLWSLSTLRQVHIIEHYGSLRDSLQNVELNNGCKLIISDKPWWR